MAIFNILLLSLAVNAAPKPALTIPTTSGIVHGLLNDNVRQFFGIPYAQPPIGDLRWERPQPLNTPRRVISATKLPPSCPQGLTSLDNSLFKNDVLEFNLQGLNVTGSTSEDCLTLSIWSPKVPKTDALPVFIFVFGGGWYNGGTDVPYQIPKQWVERTQEHIVVTINQRLNVFGWPNAEGLKDQNLGILDIRMAVEWVANNIAAFGGDPSRTTLFGQSSGGMSIDIYQYAYYKNPIISGFILHSGTAEIPLYSADYSHSNFTFLAAQFGCKQTDPKKRLSCFREVPEKAISDYIQKDLDKGQPTGLAFEPIPDGKILFANYSQRQNKIAKIPAIVGNTANEGVVFEPYPVENPDAGVNLTDAAIVTAAFFTCPTAQTTRYRENSGQTTFRFLYSGNFSNISPRPWEGAYHQSDLPMIFGTYNNYRGKGPLLETETSRAMQDAWLAFGKHGAVGLQSTGWQPFQIASSNVREFGNKVPVRTTRIANVEERCGISE